MGNESVSFLNGMTVSRLRQQADEYETGNDQLYACLLFSDDQDMRTGTRIKRWRKGQIAATLPGEPVKIHFEQKWSSIVVALPADVLRRFHNVDRWIKCARNGPWMTHDSTGDPLARHLLMSAAKLRLGDEPLLVDHVADGIRQRFAAWFDEESGILRQRDPRIDRAIEFIDAHLGESLDVETLARAAGVSQHHFSRLFHSQIGEPPFKYVRRKRIQRSRSMLRCDLSIADIAYLTGFSSQAHMTRLFKQYLGVTPHRYRTATEDHPAS